MQLLHMRKLFQQTETYTLFASCSLSAPFKYLVLITCSLKAIYKSN